MNTNLHSYFQSSIGRKQIVATSGLLLILFLLGHLAGNLLIYLGPDAYNAYSKKLMSLRPGLYLIELALLWIFVVHMWFTAILVLENIKARGEKGYTVSKAVGNRSWATRLMPYTGTIILIFVVSHLLDFTFTAHEGPKSTVHGVDLGLYGLVFNTFKDPLHSLWYIIAVCCLGLHLSHGIQSFVQTFGYNHPTGTPLAKKLSNLLAIAIVLLYCSLPIYILFKRQMACCG